MQLRDSHRPVEALASFQEARGVLESFRNPDSNDLYNLSCIYTQLSLLLEHAATPPPPAERADLTDRAVKTLRRALAAGFRGYRGMDSDPDLDPLRGRADFRALILDRGFPLDPFARPSPIPPRGPVR